MSEDIIKGWFHDAPDAKPHVLKPHQLNTIDEVDAGLDRGLEFGLQLTDYAERPRHPSAQVRSRRDRM